MKHKIGIVSQLVGISAKAIRYYESVGLVKPTQRTDSGWPFLGHRLFEDEEVDRLRFIKEARQLDFSIEQIRQLLEHFESGPPCGCGSRPLLKQLIQQKLSEIDASISGLQALRARAVVLQERCLRLQGAGPEQLLGATKPALPDAVLCRIPPTKPGGKP